LTSRLRELQEIPSAVQRDEWADWSGAGDKSHADAWYKTRQAQNEIIHGIGSCICGDVLRPVTRVVDRATVTGSLPRIANKFGPGASTQAMHDPAGGVLEDIPFPACGKQ